MRGAFVVPEELARRTVARLGEAGQEWLDRLPSAVAEYERRWSLSVRPPFQPGGATAWVAPADRDDGVRAVLKLSIPERENLREADALERWDGDGAVRLLADDGAGALLLERCDPGTPLSALPDEAEANAVAAAVLRRLWRPVAAGHPFESLAHRAAEWAESVPVEFERFGRPVEPDLVRDAVSFLTDRAAAMQERVLLHQDFHQGNVLAAAREPWLAIDPKPLVGEREFDAGGLLRDRRPELERDTDGLGRMARRLDQLARELDVDAALARGWAIAQGVELALWSFSIDDRDGGELDLVPVRLLWRL